VRLTAAGLIFLVIRVVRILARGRLDGLQEGLGTDRDGANAAGSILYSAIGAHHNGPLAESRGQSAQLVVRGSRGAGEDYLYPAAHWSTARPSGAVEHDGERIGKIARHASHQRQERGPPGLETLALARSQFGIAANDVVAVDEPAHRQGNGLS
jgi:hypothetical protein